MEESKVCALIELRATAVFAGGRPSSQPSSGGRSVYSLRALRRSCRQTAFSISERFIRSARVTASGNPIAGIVGCASHPSARRIVPESCRPGKVRSVLVAILVMIVLLVGLWEVTERHDWQIAKTNQPKRIAIVYRFRSTIEQLCWRPSYVSMSAFARQTRKAGYVVKVADSPDERELVDLLNWADIVYLLGHGAQGWFRQETGVYDSNGVPIRAIWLGGTLFEETDDALSGYNGLIPAPFITSSELHGKINNPDLIVVAASCGLGACDAMYKAIKPRLFVAPKDAIAGGGIRAAWEFTVVVLNGEDEDEGLADLKKKSPQFTAYGLTGSTPQAD